MITHEHALKGGIASGKARNTPAIIALKQKAVELHVQQDLSVNQVGKLLNRNQGVIRKWLIAAKVYRIGHRKPGGDPSNRRISQRRIDAAQRNAWEAEWKSVQQYDEAKHWRNHPDVNRFRQIAQYARQKVRDAVNKPWIKRYLQERIDPQRRIGKSLRHRIWKALKNQNALKRHRSRILIGCNRQTLVAHLAARFTAGMTMENYGTAWEVDHIIPCSHFDLTDEAQQRACFHYSNLQPLHPSVNRSKHALEPHWKHNIYSA